jgi:hypothetical protein
LALRHFALLSSAFLWRPLWHSTQHQPTFRPQQHES